MDDVKDNIKRQNSLLNVFMETSLTCLRILECTVVIHKWLNVGRNNETTELSRTGVNTEETTCV